MTTELIGYFEGDERANEQAEEELRFALAYFGSIARKAGMTLRDDVISERVLEPPRRALQRLNTPMPAPVVESEEENS